MQGFTLIESVIVILIITTLLYIGIKYSFINNDVLYIKNATYNISSSLNKLKEMSFSRKKILNNTDNTACSYGLLISTKTYESKSFATATYVNCDKIASTSPLEFVNDNYNYPITKSFEIVDSSYPPNMLLKESFNNIKIQAATATDDNQCDQATELLVENKYKQILITFYNPFGNYLVLGKKSDNTWEKILLSNESAANELFVCIIISTQTTNKKLIISIDKIGQIRTKLY